MCCSYEYISDFEKFKEELRRKEKPYSWLKAKEIIEKEYEPGLKVCNAFETNTQKDYHDLYLKCNALLLADVFKKFKNSFWKIMGSVQVIIWVHLVLVGMPCLKWQKLGLNLLEIVTYIYSLKKVQEAEFLIDIAKLAINISNLMAQNKRQNILYT